MANTIQKRMIMLFKHHVLKKTILYKCLLSITSIFIIPTLCFAQEKATAGRSINPADFMLGLISGILSGLLIWYVKERVERQRANKFFKYLARMLLKEIDILFSTLKNNIHEEPNRYAIIIKEQLTKLNDSSKSIIREYSWLLEKMDIRKSSLLIEIMPILTDWTKALDSLKLVKIILHHYDSGEEDNPNFKEYIELKSMLIDYRARLNNATRHS